LEINFGAFCKSGFSTDQAQVQLHGLGDWHKKATIRLYMRQPDAVHTHENDFAVRFAPLLEHLCEPGNLFVQKMSACQEQKKPASVLRVIFFLYESLRVRNTLLLF